MKYVFWIVFLGSALFGYPQIFLHQEVTISKDSYQKAKRQGGLSIRTTPIFFEPKMHSYNQGVLIYDLYEFSHHYGKQLDRRKIVGGISLNKIYASKVGENTPVRWILGSGVYLNTSLNKGIGALSVYSHTALSAEVRTRISGQFLIDSDHMLELLLQFPIFGMGLFGYDSAQGENALFVVRLFL